MSISDAINNARQKINNVYNALEAKGATMPATKTLDYMVTTVEAIPEFWQTINLFNGWNATINEYGFVLTQGPNVASVTVPNINGVYLNAGAFSQSAVQGPIIIESVDLQGTPFLNGNMISTFRSCSNLVSVNGINENVTNMSKTFQSCSNFNQSIQIPDAVADVSNTFRECTRFSQYVQIPSSVTNMYETFYRCKEIAVNVLSEDVNNAVMCFDLSGGSKGTVIIPFTYANSVNTTTFDSFVTAGYLYANGVSNSSKSVTVYDSALYQYAYRYVGDGIYVYLNENIPSEGDYVYVNSDSTGVNFYNSGSQIYNVGESSFYVNINSTEYWVSGTPYSHLPDPIHIVTQ